MAAALMLPRAPCGLHTHSRGAPCPLAPTRMLSKAAVKPATFARACGPVQGRPGGRHACGADRGPGAFGGQNPDSDVAFVGKILGISFAGALVIKYGSLLLDAPFTPDAALALALVLGPPAAYATLLWATSQKDQKQ